VQQRHRRVGSNAERLPCGEARVPQEREVVVGEITGVDELLGEGEVVLGAEADDLDLVCVRLSELPDFGALAPAGRSMRCVEPQQDGTVAVHRFTQTGDRPVGDIEDLDVEHIVALLEVVDVLSRGLAGRAGFRGVGRSALGSAGGGEESDPDHGDGQAASKGECSWHRDRNDVAAKMIPRVLGFLGRDEQVFVFRALRW
jgi:hypothetical protein